MTTTYEVIYFAVHGRAEPIRLLLALAGQPFKNRPFERDEWPKLKTEMPLGQVPVLVERDEDGERVVPQSQAILRHLARKFGLAGKNEAEMLAIDVVAETVLDASAGLSALIYGPGRGDAAVFAKHFGEVWPMHGKRLEKLLAQNASNSGFFVGAQASYADVFAFQVLHAKLTLSPTALDAFPTLRAFHDRMAALPQWKGYIDARPAHEGVSARPAA
jgi:glutathione S-transferase